MSTTNENPVRTVEAELLPVTQVTAIEAVERVQIDTQIATAKRFPRDTTKALALIMGDACRNEAVAGACVYKLPGRRKQDGSIGAPITGPSIRVAEIFASRYGNLHISPPQVVGDDGKFITVRCMIRDVETNTVTGRECRRRVTTKNGQRFGDDMVGVTTAAAYSIARRGAIFDIIPRAYVDEVCEKAALVAKGDAKTLVARRTETLAGLLKKGVTAEKVCAALEVAGIENIGLDELQTLYGFAVAIKEGTATLDEIFNPQPEAPAAPKATILGKDGKPEPLAGEGAAS